MFDPLTGTTVALVSTMIRHAMLEHFCGPRASIMFRGEDCIEGLFFYLFFIQTPLKYLNSNDNGKTVPYNRIKKKWDRQADIRKDLLVTIMLERVRNIL